MTEIEYIKELLLKNWFKYDKEIKSYIRDDLTCISRQDKDFVISFDWLEKLEFCKNRFELIWKLCFYQVLNTL